MNKRVWLAPAALLAAVLFASPSSADAPPARPAPSAQGELAEHFDALAFDIAHGGAVTAPGLRIAALFAEAASRLNPTEPRYLRDRYEYLTVVKDSDGQIDTLNKYLTLIPDDQFAQLRLITTYAQRMQTADKIIAYLRSIVAKTVLPAPVRARAAVICAQTLLDHAQKAEALKMLDNALQIEPIDEEALTFKYQLSQDEGVTRRVGLLLALLRSNPVNAPAALALARELADVGLPTPSSEWYSNAAQLFSLSGSARPAELGTGVATELFLADDDADVLKVIEGYLTSIPGDADAWAIRLAAVKDMGTKAGDYDDLTRQAVASVLNELQAIRLHLGAPNAATQPVYIDSSVTSRPLPPVPDVSGDVSLLVKANDPKLTDSYLAVTAKLAWLRLYFARDAGEGTQRLLDVLGRLLPADDAELARLVGWSYLDNSKWDQARQKLGAVADREPFAQLGMVLLDEQAGDKTGAAALARSCMAAHPSGPAAAVLYGALKSRGAKVIALNQAELIKTQIANFPNDWFNIVARPTDFYSVRAEFPSQTIDYTQAVLAKITIQNTSDFDITFGDDGTLHPGLVFDASLRGIIEKQYPAFAYSRMWGRLVIPKHGSASQVFRLDRGVLRAELDNTPDEPVDLQYSVTINPEQIRQEGQDQPTWVFGPAGNTVPFADMIERSPAPYESADNRTQLYKGITDDSAVVRFRVVATLFNFVQGLSRPAANSSVPSPENLAIAQEILTHLQPAGVDTDNAIRAWTNYCKVVVAAPSNQTGLVPPLTQSDDWYARVLGLAAARVLPDRGALVGQVMQSDPDPLVKKLAIAISDYITSTPTTQPAK